MALGRRCAFRALFKPPMTTGTFAAIVLLLLIAHIVVVIVASIHLLCNAAAALLQLENQEPLAEDMNDQATAWETEYQQVKADKVVVGDAQLLTDHRA